MKAKILLTILCINAKQQHNSRIVKAKKMETVVIYFFLSFIRIFLVPIQINLKTLNHLKGSVIYTYNTMMAFHSYAGKWSKITIHCHGSARQKIRIHNTCCYHFLLKEENSDFMKMWHSYHMYRNSIPLRSIFRVLDHITSYELWPNWHWKYVEYLKSNQFNSLCDAICHILTAICLAKVNNLPQIFKREMYLLISSIRCLCGKVGLNEWKIRYILAMRWKESLWAIYQIDNCRRTLTMM